MFKNRGRHARPRVRIGPGFAFGALMLALNAKREMLAASSAQSVEVGR